MNQLCCEDRKLVEVGVFTEAVSAYQARLADRRKTLVWTMPAAELPNEYRYAVAGTWSLLIEPAAGGRAAASRRSWTAPAIA